MVVALNSRTQEVALIYFKQGGDIQEFTPSLMTMDLCFQSTVTWLRNQKQLGLCSCQRGLLGLTCFKGNHCSRITPPTTQIPTGVLSGCPCLTWCNYVLVTCSFQIDGLVYQDYVRAKTKDFDLLDFDQLGQCRQVEYINVRGHSCSHCQTIWFQSSQEILHLDSSSKQCNFDPSPGAVHTEDNFGYYMTFSPKFRCTDPGRESTTNHWFGGFLVNWGIVTLAERCPSIYLFKWT